MAVCGRAVNTSYSGTEGPRVQPSPARRLVPKTERTLLHFVIFTQVYRRLTAGGSPCDELASRPGSISNTPRHASCKGNQDRLRPFGPLTYLLL